MYTFAEASGVPSKINAFSVDPAERRVFAGTLQGELVVVDVESFQVVHRVLVAAGQIEGVAVHPSLPIVGVFSADNMITLWRFDGSGELTHMFDIATRQIHAENPELERALDGATFSSSYALAFHPTERRLLTRTAYGAAAELAFDDTSWTVRWCRALFPRAGAASEDLLYARYLVDSELVLCSATSVIVFDPKQREVPLVQFRRDHQNIHEATHVGGSDYLLACDSGEIVRFDVSGARPPLVGPRVTRDDLERIAYDRRSGRAFLTGFDRRVIEIDPQTCEPRGTVFEAPYSLRGIAVLDRRPGTMLLHCYNGALLKLDVAQRRATGIIKETHNALWSAAAVAPGRIWLAGEGAEVLSLDAAGVDPVTLERTFEARWRSTGADPGSFTKRIAASHRGVVMARTDGEIRLVTEHDDRALARLPAAIRDVAVAGDDVYAACEDGTAYRIDLASGEVAASYRSAAGEPVWSLAVNVERGLLAVAEREGHVELLDRQTLVRRDEAGTSSRTTRMRWLDADHLLIGRRSMILEYNLATGERQARVSVGGNVLDFDWDAGRRYLGVISYLDLSVIELETFALLSVGTVKFDFDMPKGLLWLPADAPDGAYPHELLAFGRSGLAKLYRIHNDRVTELGPVHTSRSKPVAIPGRFAS